MYKSILSEEQIRKCYEENLQGKDLSDLAKENGVSWHSMYQYFKKRNLPYKKGLHSKTKYQKLSNHNYFSLINSHEKAYLLGILYADGWIRKEKNEIGLSLKCSDIKIIEYLKQSIGSENKLSIQKNQVHFSFSSKKIVDDLLNLGLKRSKTYKQLSLPNIEKEYLNSFVLGFLDGDGWISVSKLNVQIGICSCLDNILEEIKIYLLENNINSKIYCDKRSLKNEKHKDLYSLVISDNKSKKLFLKLIYKDSSLYLNRKYQKMLNANTVLNSKISKGLESV
jgi:hypothetical protein